MDNEIKSKIKKCPTCLTFRNHQPSEPIINDPIPNQTWTEIAVDPFRLYGHHYSLMINYYFIFFVIEMIKKITIVNCYK